MYEERFKGTVSVISSDPTCKNGKGTVVNQALHGGSLKITLTVLLKDVNEIKVN